MEKQVKITDMFQPKKRPIQGPNKRQKVDDKGKWVVNQDNKASVRALLLELFGELSDDE